MKELYKLPKGVLRFIISDVTPVIHAQEPPTKRMVTIKLTRFQQEALLLKRTGMDGKKARFENISDVFFEIDTREEQDNG